MLNVTDLRQGDIFKKEGVLYRVLNYTHQKQARGGASAVLKARNLSNDSVVRKVYPSGMKVESVAVVKKEAQYLYREGGKVFFMDKTDYEQFAVEKEKLGEKIKFLKEGLEASVLLCDEKIIDVELPIKVDYEVEEAPPNIKGNTSQGGVKEVFLSGGLKVKTPMFIKKGDIIKVDTRTGEYIERS